MADDATPAPAAPQAKPPEDEVEVIARFPAKWKFGVLAALLAGSGGGTVLASRVLTDSTEEAYSPRVARLEERVNAHDAAFAEKDKADAVRDTVTARTDERLKSIDEKLKDLKEMLTTDDRRRRR